MSPTEKESCKKESKEESPTKSGHEIAANLRLLIGNRHVCAILKRICGRISRRTMSVHLQDAALDLEASCIQFRLLRIQQGGGENKHLALVFCIWRRSSEELAMWSLYSINSSVQPRRRIVRCCSPRWHIVENLSTAFFMPCRHLNHPLYVHWTRVKYTNRNDADTSLDIDCSFFCPVFFSVRVWKDNSRKKGNHTIRRANIGHTWSIRSDIAYTLLGRLLAALLNIAFYVWINIHEIFVFNRFSLHKYHRVFMCIYSVLLYNALSVFCP